MNEGCDMNKQKGLTLISWLIVIAFVGFNGLMALNVAPVYINDSSVKSIMANLERDADVRGKDARKLKDIVIKRLKINNLYDIKKDNITVTKGRNSYVVTIEYEPRGRLVGNLDYIISFKHEARVQSK
jgi:hypothetical protein